MAKLICAKSGTYFSCEFMPLAFSAPTLAHPIFAVPQHKLLALAGKWAAGKLSDTESYLLFLSLLDSTGLVVWRTHALHTPETSAIVANNMESLLQVISKVNLIKHPSFTIPQFSITTDTASLDNVEHWIEIWDGNYHDWKDSIEDSRKLDEIRDKIQQREAALQRLIKSSTNPDTYAGTLADWASVAGGFPTFDTVHPITKTAITCNEYWKQIIRTVANDDKLWRFPRKDIVELIEHCEDNIVLGSIYSNALLTYLRNGLSKYDNYLGFGDLGISAPPKGTGTAYTLMPATSSAHQINRAALIDSAPTAEPLKSAYPSHFAWLKDYAKWKLAKGN